MLTRYFCFFFPVSLLPTAGHPLLILDVSRSHSLHAPHSVGLLCTSDQLVLETSTSQHTTLTTQSSIPPVVFEPTISAGERPWTYTLDRAATGTGHQMLLQL